MWQNATMKYSTIILIDTHFSLYFIVFVDAEYNWFFWK